MTRQTLLDAFARHLRELRLACGGPSYRQLHRRSEDLPPATVSDMLRAKTAPRLEVVRAFVRACLAHAADVGASPPPGMADLRDWEAQWRELHRNLPEVVRGRRAQATAAADAADRPGALARVPRQLPTLTRGFVGRQADLTWLDGFFRASSSECDIAVLTGMGGSGKTAAAVAWAHRRADRYCDGQLFVDLNGFGRGAAIEPAEVLHRFLHDLGSPPPTPTIDLNQLVSHYRTTVAGRSMLIVLDNAQDEDQVRPLLPGSPTVDVLITSRVRLSGLVVEYGAEARSIGPLERSESMLLLEAGLQVRTPGDAGNHEDAADASDAAEIDRLADLCGDLPLALRLAVQRVLPQLDDLDLPAVVDDLDRAGTPVEELDRAVDHPTSKLSNIFAWSLDAIEGPDASAFHLLALHPGTSLSATAAASLLGMPLVEARDTLTRLTSANLLTAPRRGRLAMHDLLRAWALDHDAAGSDRDNALKRLCSFYLHMCDAADRQLLPHRGREPLDGAPPAGVTLPKLSGYDGAATWLDSEILNIAAMVGVAFKIGDDATAAAVPHVLMSYLNLRKPWPLWIQMHGTGLDAARRSGDDRARAHLLLGLGTAKREVGQLDEAIALFEEAIAAYRALDLRTGEAMALNNLATLFNQSARPAAAVTALGSAAGLLKDEPWRKAIVLHNLAEAEQKLGHLDEALDHAGQALKIEESLGDEAGAAATMTTLAAIHALLGDHDLALSIYAEASELQQRLGDARGQAVIDHRVGALLHALGNHGEAVPHLEAAIATLSSLGDTLAAQVRALLTEVTNRRTPPVGDL